MQYNKKNILFKIFAKQLRFLKELRSSYGNNIHDANSLFFKIKEELDLVVSVMDAQYFVEVRDVDIRGLYPSKYKIHGSHKDNMERAFFAFLLKKGIYEKYMDYSSDHHTHGVVLHDEVMRWIDVCGFFWTETEEGPEFWCDVSHEWKDFCITTTILDDNDEIKD